MKNQFYQLEHEQEFKRAFAVQFLASYVALNYDKWCSEGEQESLTKPPVEDAEFLANKAWDHWVRIIR